MPIIITNITENPKPSGIHEYEVRVNSKVLFRFKHDRGESISVLFENAMIAAKNMEKQQRQASIKRLVDYAESLNW